MSQTKTRSRKRQPKKTKKAETKKSFYGFTGPEYPEGIMHMSPMDLMKFELAQAKAANMSQAAMLKRKEMEDFQRHFNERMHQLRQEQSQLEVGRKDAVKAFDVAKVELQEAYGMDLTKIIYDDQSGKIHVIQEDGTPTPLLESVDPPAPPAPPVSPE